MGSGLFSTVRRSAFVFACALFVAADAAFAERQWTNKDGRAVTATFVRLTDGMLTFKKGSRTFQIEVNELSRPDLDYVLQRYLHLASTASCVRAKWLVFDGKTILKDESPRLLYFTGTILQVLTRAAALVVLDGSRKTVCVVGDATDKVDDDRVHMTVVEAGTYSYTSVVGAPSKVRKYRAIDIDEVSEQEVTELASTKYIECVNAYGQEHFDEQDREQRRLANERILAEQRLAAATLRQREIREHQYSAEIAKIRRQRDADMRIRRQRWEAETAGAEQSVKAAAAQYHADKRQLHTLEKRLASIRSSLRAADDDDKARLRDELTAVDAQRLPITRSIRKSSAALTKAKAALARARQCVAGAEESRLQYYNSLEADAAHKLETGADPVDHWTH